RWFLGRQPLGPSSNPSMLLQLNYLRPASSSNSRLVKRGNPAHANPSTQVPAARRNDRPTARRRTTGRKHELTDRIRAPHNPYIVTPINARNEKKAAAAGVTAQPFEIAPELTGHGLPLGKCEAYNRVYDQFYQSR